MNVYIVTSGEYSAYHIEAVFTDKNQAQIFANMSTDRCVEEYPVDTVQYSGTKTFMINVTYNFANNQIESFEQADDESHADEPMIGIDWYTTFYFSVLVSGRLFDDIAKSGKDSSMLLKIAQDKFYAELDRIGKTKKQLLHEKQKIKDEVYSGLSNYVFYNTSL